MPTAAGRRRHLLAVLERHGLSLAVAETARTTGLRLREETIRHRIERGVLIDAETGDLLDGVIAGSGDRLELGPLLIGMAPGRRYVCVHTHPDSTSLSVLDVGLLVEHPAVVFVAALGVDGTWFAGSFDPQQPLPSSQAVYEAYVTTYHVTLEQYQALRAAGQLTRRQVARRHSHDIWVQAGPVLVLRYDRVERT